MVKTLVELKDSIYRKLIELSLQKYGHPRGLSKVINEILEKFLGKRRMDFGPTIRLGRKITVEEINKIRKEVWTE